MEPHGDSAALIGTIGGVAVLVIGAIAGAAVKIIEALGKNTAVQTETQDLVVAGQTASRARGIVAARKTQEIHLLVNSRLQVVLRVLVTMTKKEADRTRLPEDIKAYQIAVAELARAEASNVLVGEADERAAIEDDVAEAAAAEARVAALIARRLGPER